MEVRSRNGGSGSPSSKLRDAQAKASTSSAGVPDRVILPPIEKSKPAQLGLQYKWIVVIAATIFSTYFFEAREFELLTWLFSFRALFYTAAMFTMIGSFAFPVLRPGVFVIMVLYEALLIWIMTTGVDLPEIRRMINTTAHAPLNETAYDSGCEVYDADHPQPFHNIIDKLDNFVWLHIIGYVFKFLFLRSWWLCHTLSVSFELAEYSLEHHLPNFRECWWDHWIADAMLSNVLGMYIGSKIITVTGLEVMVGELNTFYIKSLLWLPPEHWYNCLRVLIAVSASLPAANELYHELQGRERRWMPLMFCWGVSAMQYTEMAVYVTLGREKFIVPFPQHIVFLWSGILIVCVAYVVWRLVLRYFIMGPEEGEMEGELHYLQQQHHEQEQQIKWLKEKTNTE